MKMNFLTARALTVALAATMAISPFAAIAQAAAPAQKTSAEPWKQIPIPPLPAFHPAQPKRIQLANGMVIFLQEDHELPLIDGFIVIRGGSRDEPANKVGLVDMYGQAWRTSGTTTHTGDQLDDMLAEKAASVETSGDVNSTGVSWSCLKGDFNFVFGVVTDLLEHPNFKQSKLLLAQQQEATGIMRRNDDASEIAGREARKLVQGSNNPYARVPEFATVQAVTVNDLKQWHDKTVAPQNMILGIVGDFNSAEMEAKLRAAFGSMQGGPVFKTPEIPIPGPKPGVYFVNKTDINQSSVYIVGLGTKRNNPDYYALTVMNQIFSGGFGSRLVNDVRTKLGLAYEVAGSYGASYDHPGIFYTIAGTKSATTVAAAQAMLQQIKELKTVPPTPAEMRAAKDELLNSFIFHYDSPDKILREQANLEFYGYPADFLSKYRDAIEKVTAADVSRVANKYVDPAKLAILVVGNKAQLGTPLTTLGPVTNIDITIPMPAGAKE
ncbi:MAG: M16 family metallopeptidase [Acidobacteriaceae bacterium]